MSLLDKIKITLEIDKYGYNPLRIITTILRKATGRLKNEKTEMYLFEMEFLPTNNLDIDENVEIIDEPEKLLNFVKYRANEDKDCLVEKYYEQIKTRFKNEGWCYAYKMDNKIVSVVFISPTEEFSTAINYTFKMPHKTVGVIDGYTLKEYRGKGLYNSLYDFGFNDIVSRGFTKGWFWIMPRNLVTLYLHKKVGVKNAIKKISLIQRLGIRWHKEEKINLNIDDLIEISKTLNKNEN